MDKSGSKQVDENTNPMGVEKKADILQATFLHHYRMAMDHHTKAGTTSNILLVIVGAILVLVGFDKEICHSVVDLGSAIAVIIIGLFGALWALKQHELYHYWEFIAIEYQKKLIEIMPELKTRRAYNNDAEAYAAKKFGPVLGPFLAKRLKDRHLWVGLHVIVVVIGIVIFILSLLETCPS